MYISLLEFDQIRRGYLNGIEVDIPCNEILKEKLEDGPYFLKNELKKKLTEIIDSYINLFKDFIKNKTLHEIDEHFTEITERDIMCNFDEYLFYIFKKELEKLFGSKIEINIYKSGKYQDFIEILKEYYDDLNNILELKIDNIIKFIEMYVKLFEKVKEMKDYVYKGSKHYAVNAKSTGSIFKKYGFSEDEIEFFNEMVKKLSKVLIFKDKIGLNKRKEELMDIPNDKNDTVKNVYLLPGPLTKNKGTIFEVISYLYMRKILNRIKPLFLSTHNLLLKLEGDEKEIDIPILLYYEDRYIFILIECKFKDLNNKDVQRLNQLKEKLNAIPIENEICILTMNSNEISIRENVYVVQISKFEEWIKEKFLTSY